MADGQPEGEHDPSVQPAWAGATIPSFNEEAWKKKLKERPAPVDPGPQLPLLQRVEKFIVDWKIDRDIANKLRKEDPSIVEKVILGSLWYANNPSYVLMGRINKLKGQTPVKQKLCRDFEMTGICEFDNRCMFSHDRDRLKLKAAEESKSARLKQVNDAVQSIEMTLPGVAPAVRTEREQALAPGDWICPHCKDHQFARNSRCRTCSEPRPAGAGAPQQAYTQHSVVRDPQVWLDSQAKLHQQGDHKTQENFTPSAGSAQSVAQAILQEDPSWLPHGARMQPHQEMQPREPEPVEPMQIVLPWKKLRPEEMQIVTEDDYASILAHDLTITHAATIQTNVRAFAESAYVGGVSWPATKAMAKRQKNG